MDRHSVVAGAHTQLYGNIPLLICDSWVLPLTHQDWLLTGHPLTALIYYELYVISLGKQKCALELFEGMLLSFVFSSDEKTISQ